MTTYEAHFGRGGAITAQHYMRGPGGFDYNTASEVGHRVRYPVTVTAFWGKAQLDTSGWRIRLTQWDDSASSGLPSGPSSLSDC